ncbi:MAG TPA: FtsQ-type POTRA domain-containing protein [Thermoanaerobaculia bacterium]|nr:FtsQ-type POTRA domain-containing protein [Thermoanaerobaculia bacterium]
MRPGRRPVSLVLRGGLAEASRPIAARGSLSDPRERGSTFRRKAVAPRRRRRSLLLRVAGPLAPPLALLGLPLAVAGWVVSAPQFALREVVAVGGPRVPAAWLEAALAPLQGANLVRLPLAAAAARVRRHPWVAEAELTKELPGRLRIAVVERRPVALLARGGALYFADEDGRAIAPVGPGGRAARDAQGLLVVEAPERTADGLARALQVAAALGRANPTWAGNLTHVEVLGDRDFRLATAALPFALYVREGDVLPKVRRLESLLPDLAGRYAAVAAVDLRFARRIVVQPMSSSPGSQPAAPAPPLPRGDQPHA